MTTPKPIVVENAGAPRHPDVHLISGAGESWVLGVETGQLRELGQFQAQALDAALEAGSLERGSLMAGAAGPRPEIS